MRGQRHSKASPHPGCQAANAEEQPWFALEQETSDYHPPLGGRMRTLELDVPYRLRSPQTPPMQRGLRGDPRETGTIPASQSVAFWGTPVLGPRIPSLVSETRYKWLRLTEPASPVRERLNLESTHCLHVGFAVLREDIRASTLLTRELL